MLGKSVLPRVLVRVTLLLPAHLPVLIGLRVSTVSVCVSVSVARAHQQTQTPNTYPYTGHTARLLVQVGE